MTDEAKQPEEVQQPASDGAAPSTDAASPSTESGAPEAESAPTDPLEEARTEALQLKDKLMRTAADFDNYRKRTRRELLDAEKKGREQLLKDLLPVFDNLERATAHASQGADFGDAAKGLIDGISLVMKQFGDALSRLGIERVDSVGKPFDPSLHEAIQHLETAEFPPGHIAAEVQPGYKDGDRLLRPALVVVAKAPAEASSTVAPSSNNGAHDEDADQSGAKESPGT